jgi:uncharacterized protein (TIGR02391 family)
MPSMSPLAQKAIEALQRAIQPGESYFDRGQALLNLLNLAPQGSALARALYKSHVWSDTWREQTIKDWSAHGHPPNRPRVGTGGYQMHYFLERLDKVVDAESPAVIEEQHIAKALLGDDGRFLQELGVNGTALVKEVTQLESVKGLVRKSVPRGLELERLHPAILEAAGRLFADGHYGPAIFEAYKAVEVRVRNLSGVDGIGQDLMAKAFGGDRPPIRITTQQDAAGKDEQEGFRFIFMGAMRGIRNPKGHNNIEQHDVQRTLEYLAIASLLMRRLDDAVVLKDKS